MIYFRKLLNWNFALSFSDARKEVGLFNCVCVCAWLFNVFNFHLTLNAMLMELVFGVSFELLQESLEWKTFHANYNQWLEMSASCWVGNESCIRSSSCN